jgi:radical SAM superfamily enzyme YgiQ (UPF0313 family)
LWDNNAENIDEERFYEKLIGLKDEILCVGVSIMIGHQIREALAFSKVVREIAPELSLIWGGAMPTTLPEMSIREPNVTIIVRGQGEEAFRDLVERVTHGQSLGHIQGISYKEDSKILHNPDRGLTDINEFPPYSSVYDLINLNQYIRPDEHINTHTVSYHSSQGCVWGCGFCCETGLWKRRWSGLRAERIIADIEYLAENYGVNGIKFYDSEFAIDRRRVLEFSRGLIDIGLDIKWGASVHPKSLLRFSEEEFALMKKSGAARFLIGAESALDEELALIGKNTNKEMIRYLAKLCGKYEIAACFDLIVGFPGSPESYIKQTMDFAEELVQMHELHEAKLHLYAPYPGTPLYQRALQHGFRPPRTLTEWSWHDFYDVVVPWVDEKYVTIVREFNERNYPYIHPKPANNTVSA